MPVFAQNVLMSARPAATTCTAETRPANGARARATMVPMLSGTIRKRTGSSSAMTLFTGVAQPPSSRSSPRWTFGPAAVTNAVFRTRRSRRASPGCATAKPEATPAIAARLQRVTPKIGLVQTMAPRSRHHAQRLRSAIGMRAVQGTMRLLVAHPPQFPPVHVERQGQIRVLPSGTGTPVADHEKFAARVQSAVERGPKRFPMSPDASRGRAVLR